ncbi:MAG: hypothetical protein ACYC0V_21325, partial [Armatimonadota bacterium]
MPLPSLKNIDLSRVPSIPDEKENVLASHKTLPGPLAEKPREMPFLDRIKLGMNEGVPFKQFLEKQAEDTLPPESGYDVLQHKAIYNHIPLDSPAMDDVMQSLSSGELRRVVDKFDKEQKFAQDMFSDGVAEGIVGSIVPLLVDPTLLIGGYGEFKAMAALRNAALLKKAAVAAGIGGATGALMEAQSASGKVTVGADHVLTSGLVSAAASGILGPLGFGRNLTDEIADTIGKRSLDNLVSHEAQKGVKELLDAERAALIPRTANLLDEEVAQGIRQELTDLRASLDALGPAPAALPKGTGKKKVKAATRAAEEHAAAVGPAQQRITRLERQIASHEDAVQATTLLDDIDAGRLPQNLKDGVQAIKEKFPVPAQRSLAQGAKADMMGRQLDPELNDALAAEGVGETFGIGAGFGIPAEGVQAAKAVITPEQRVT